MWYCHHNSKELHDGISGLSNSYPLKILKGGRGEGTQKYHLKTSKEVILWNYLFMFPEIDFYNKGVKTIVEGMS